MPTFSVNMKHTAESCPMFNAEVKKRFEEMHTARGEKRKGYGRKLLVYIEKNAKAHGATTMKTGDIDPCSDEAIGFFRSMDYGLRPIENYATKFLKEQKDSRKHLLPPIYFGKLKLYHFLKRLMPD